MFYVFDISCLQIQNNCKIKLCIFKFLADDKPAEG